MDAHPLDLPPGLEEAIAERRAQVVEAARGKTQHPRRTYLVLDSPSGRLHGFYSRDEQDARIVAHEARVRALVGTRGPLRAPPVLAWGQGWLLSETAKEEPLAGRSLAETVAAAAARLAELDLPKGPWGGRDVGLVRLWRRRLEMLGSPLPLRDLLAARRVAGTLDLPKVGGHGYFHPVHVFARREFAWVIDWELSGPVPAGFDLLNYWTGVDDPEAREALFDAAVELAGRSREQQLRRLRYALTVRAIVSHLKEGADPREARRLLALLPDLRREARV